MGPPVLTMKVDKHEIFWYKRKHPEEEEDKAMSSSQNGRQQIISLHNNEKNWERVRQWHDNRGKYLKMV